MLSHSTRISASAENFNTSIPNKMIVKVIHNTTYVYVDFVKLVEQLKAAINEENWPKVVIMADCIQKISAETNSVVDEYKSLSIYLYQQLFDTKQNRLPIILAALVFVESRGTRVFIRTNSVLKALMQNILKDWVGSNIATYILVFAIAQGEDAIVEELVSLVDVNYACAGVPPLFTVVECSKALSWDKTKKILVALFKSPLTDANSINTTKDWTAWFLTFHLYDQENKDAAAKDLYEQRFPLQTITAGEALIYLNGFGQIVANLHEILATCAKTIADKIKEDVSQNNNGSKRNSYKNVLRLSMSSRNSTFGADEAGIFSD